MKQGKRLLGYKKTVLKIAVGMIFFICGVLILTNKGVLNLLVSRNYPVQGVDVSHYQGKIDWEKFREQQVVFAFIKATEGSSHTDEYFADNWENAKTAGIVAGAYHFLVLTVRLLHRQNTTLKLLGICPAECSLWWMWNTTEIRNRTRQMCERFRKVSMKC